MASSSSVFRLQHSSSTDKLTLDNSGNLSVAGTGSFSSLVSDTIVYNSGNCNFKQQGGSYTKQLEQQSGGNYVMWDEGNNEIYHISTDRQMWWGGDFNVAGTYYDSGVPIVPSSIKLKSNTQDLDQIENKTPILDKINFKHY